KSGPNSAERVLLVQRRRRIHRYHRYNLLGRAPKPTALKRTHLCKQAQTLIAGEAISPKANVEPKTAQSFGLKGAVTKILMTARRMGDMEFCRQFFNQFEVGFGQFV